jgi:hypothetical protein
MRRFDLADRDLHTPQVSVVINDLSLTGIAVPQCGVSPVAVIFLAGGAQIVAFHANVAAGAYEGTPGKTPIVVVIAIVIAIGIIIVTAIIVAPVMVIPITVMMVRPIVIMIMLAVVTILSVWALRRELSYGWRWLPAKQS